MTDPGDPLDERESEKIRELVRRALANDALVRDAPDILRGVQRRLRKRQRGNLFVRGWSGAQARTVYILVALVTVLLAAVAYFGLLPLVSR
jgi:hypothetical protein